MLEIQRVLKLIFVVLITVIQASCGGLSSTQSFITWDECGGRVGDHACDFTFMSQTGEEWNLYERYGKIVVLDFSAMWCGYCQKAAEVAQQIQDEHDDVVWVTILLQNNYGQQPSLNELIEWATAFDVTSSPILSGNASIIDQTAENGFNVKSWPGLVVIDRDMKIAYELHGWNEAQIKVWLKSLITKTRDSER